MLYNSIKELIAQVSHTRNVAFDETESDGLELPVLALCMNQIEYNEKYENLKNQHDKINKKLSNIEDLKFEMRTKKHKTEEFIENLNRVQNC